ncbi:GNAT family N-acetyltransferase [Glycomyces terrestris]|uniref:N-acetyltransferase n=1 Tax=Glycomyces terrestris TaxID=2493553 RepID=A0A426UWE1_9ACTN|nr:GNAT family N-acetyltransferase [Glycomyces terrestris]RRR98538.1 N-acetyltransferase [Glycomyces terrestris]
MNAHVDPIVEVTDSGPLLEAVYRHVLEPNFPAQELETFKDLAAGLAAGVTVFAVLDAHQVPVAAVVGSRWEPHPIVLLTYLAVTADRRSTGIGGRLLEHALETWQRRYHPHAVLAEIEDPTAYRPHPRFGDPVRRDAFYTRHGAAPVLVPYVQPEVRVGCGRRPHMRLIGFQPQSRAVNVSPSLLLPFLEAYFEAAEGRAPTDAQARQLFAGLTP